MREKKTLCNSDPRLRWLMEQALRYFQLKDESLAVNMLERHDGRAKKELHRLFAGSDNTPSIFYVYQTTYTKTFYKEVTLKKEVPRPHDSSPQTSDRERESEESGADDRKKKKDQKKKKKLMKKKVSKTASGDEGGGDDTDKEDKKETVGEEELKPSEESKDEEMSAQEEDTGVGGTAEQMESDSKDEAYSKKAKKTKKAKTPKSKKRPQSPASVVETLPTDSSERQKETSATMTIKMKRIMRKEKKLCQLHAKFGPISWSRAKTDDVFVYFLLRDPAGVPLFQSHADAKNEMPKYFYLGQVRRSIIMDDFSRHIQMFPEFVKKFLAYPFDRAESQTDGLETFLKYRKQEKQNCPSIEAYCTADSVKLRLIALRRSLESEGGITLRVNPSYIMNPKQRKADLTRTIKFPHIANIDETDTTLQDRPDLVELVSKLRKTIRKNIKKCPDRIPEEEIPPIKRSLLDSITDINSMFVSSMKSSSTAPKNFDTSSFPELARLTKEKITGLTSNESYVQYLERTVQAWAKYVDSIVKKYQGAQPDGKGPLPLYEYWSLRHELLSPFIEECHHPIVDNMLSVLRTLNSQPAKDYKIARNHLRNYYNLCSDNVEYLKSTLTELKILSRSRELKEISAVVPNTVNGLRVMWVLSTYWGTEANFVELLARIRWVICHKVTQILNVPKLFKMGNDLARQLCQEAIDLMDMWKNSYSKTRSVIENTRCEQRWEFERDLLFQETEYISQVARNLLDIINVIKNYEDMFCQQFKNIVRNGSRIDSIVHKVKDLTMPLITADFNLFDREYAENWKILVECFWTDMKNLEADAIRVIMHSFANLRSAVKATELLHDLRAVITSEKLDKLLLSQFEAIGSRFSHEVKTIMDVFIENRDNPPILRYHEEYSGSVYWSRNLYCAVREILLTLQEDPHIQETQHYKEALEDYANFVDMIAYYEKSLFTQMLHKYQPIVPKVFEKNIIKIIKEKVSHRDDDSMEQYWSYIIKKKIINPMLSLKSGVPKKDGESARRNKVAKSVHKTIERELKGRTESSESLSESSCSSARSSDYSSADESDVLSLVSKGSSTGSLSRLMDEDDEYQEKTQNPKKRKPIAGYFFKRRSRKLKTDGESLQPKMDVFPLGSGVFKPLSEIIKEQKRSKELSKRGVPRCQNVLSNYHDYYRSTSGLSTDSEMTESDGSEGYDGESMDFSMGQQSTKSTRAVSRDFLSSGWSSSKDSSENQSRRTRRKYSNAYLRSLIKLVRLKQIAMPEKPKKATLTCHRTFQNGRAKLLHSESRSIAWSPERGTSDHLNENHVTTGLRNPIAGRKLNSERECGISRGGSAVSRGNESATTIGDSTSLNDQDSCETDSSYTKQQIRRKMLIQRYTKDLHESVGSSSINDLDDLDSTSGSNEDYFDQSDKCPAVEGQLRFQTEKQLNGLTEATRSSETAIVVARDIYDSRNVSHLLQNFDDRCLHPSKLRHPSSFSISKITHERVRMTEKSERRRTKGKSFKRRIKPLTFWLNHETDSCSSESSSVKSLQSAEIQKNRIAQYAKYQADYRKKRIHADLPPKMMEVEDWSDSYAIAQKKAKNAQQEKFTGPLCPMKSLRALISVRKHLREKLHNIRRGLPKIYSGCRHDIKRFSWNEFMGSDVLMEHGYSVQINYSAAYEVAIREIELFEELGYEIPEDLRRISVVKDSLHADFEAAVKMIRIYSAVIKSLKPTQVTALKPYISNVEKTLYFGFTQYTWSSLNIAEFCESVMTESNTLEYLANQLRHMEASIESIVMDIIEVDSFQCPTSDVYSFQVFFKFSEYRRKEAVAYVKRLYHKLTRILYRMECLLFSEMTGSSEYLLLYYIWAENTMFNGLVAYAVRNLSKYEEFLLGIPKHKFCIEALFNDGTISVNPDLAQIAFQLSTQAENIVGTLSTLVRWQEGTCHFVPQLESSNSSSIHRYSFVEDLVQCPEVKSALVHIYETVSVVVEHIDRYLEKWSKFSHLWTFDSEITMKQFLSQKPTLAEYDECFSFYHNTMEKLKSRKPAASIYCVRILISKMTTKIHEIAYKWKSIIGDQLLASSRALVVEMKQKTQELFEQLSQPIISLETFQKVLLAVNGCSAYQVEAEISLKEIYERHHLLRMWKLKIPKSDNLNAYDVEKSWHKIRRIAAYRTYLLAPTLKLFVTKANEVCDLFLKTSLVFVKKYSNEGPGTYLHDLSKGAAILGLFKIEFAETEAKRKEIVQAETLFDLQPMNFNVFCEAHEMFKDEVLVYDLYNRLQAEKENWSLVLWNNFNPKKLLAGIDSYLNEFEELSGKCKRMPISLAIKKHMLDFKRSIPLMTDLQNKALRQRHWNELMVKTGHEFNMDPLHTKMKHLFSMKLYEHYSLVAEIIANAQKEADIETKLSIISERWIDEELPIVQHFQPNGDNGVQYTLGDVTISLKSGLESLIEELLVMKKSKFSGPFKAQIEDWAFKVSETLEVLILWETVQKWWMNLEHIYKNSPEDTPGADIFRTAYVNYAEITRKAKSKPNVFMQCLHPNKKAALQSIYNNVELCSLRLRVYLNTQRELCPRFYLLTDGELMDILGGNMDPAYTLIHKMFIGVQSLLTVGQNGKHGSKRSESHRNECMQAVGMISPEQEVLEFINGVNPRDKAHLFMLNILEEMRLSLQDATYKAVSDYHNSRDNRKEWVSQHLGCTVLTSNQVGFCCMVEKAFMQMTRGSQRAMRKLLAKQTKELDEDTRVIRENLKMNDRKKLTTLLIEDAHSKDIVERFVTLNVMNAEEFEWSSQLRFYWSPDSKTLEIKQCEGSFDYGFEYMGLVHRQVITPLTERARLTITQALTMRQGTAIIGPTATGKKETIKDLADVLGVMYLLINCGSMFTLSNLNQWLKTVYSCGIWTCLDKFDRIDLSTQSAFSTTLFSARQALLASADYFYCEGYQIPLSRSTNVFITMNPGYKGRHCLPESMKSLFRPVVCMHPDTEHICTITLISEGFIEAKVLARKMSCLNKVAKTQLSEARHYDFGLKVIKSILCVAGLLKRKMPSVSEKALLKNALRDVFAPKLLDDDAVFFNGLLEDFFPAVELFRVGNAEEEVAISDSLSSSGYIKIPNQIHKIAQLQAITDMWHSVIVLGPTSGGKSVIIDTFIRTQAALGKPMKPFYLNPNICSMAELFGQYNDELTEWKDGIITQFLKDSAHHNETVSVVFDGSMDSEWIENMSTVMDDNKTLSLPNGDLINLGDQVFFLFETGHLENCSPATVSRNGLIYVNPAELGFSAYWQRWAHSRMDDYERELLHELYETFVPVCFEMLENDDLKTEVPLSTINMVAHLCLVIEAQLPIIEPPYRNDVEEPLKRSLTSKQELTCVFIQALYLSLGAVVTEECRIPFDGKIKELSAMSLVNEEPDSPISCCELPCRLLTLFSYLYQANDKQWVPWSSQVANYEHNNFLSPHQILVPNEELTKMRWTLELLNKHNCEDIEYSKFEYRTNTRPKVKRPILLIGESGSAKTSIVRQYMSTIHNEKWERLFINLTPLYGSEKLQQLIERKLMKTMRNYWEPKGNKKLLVFIDDLDMAIMDHVNSKKTNEFLKFFIEKQALLLRNRDVNRSVVHVNDVSSLTAVAAALGSHEVQVHYIMLLADCIGAMGKQATNTGAVDPRFLSLFAVYRMNTATMSTMKYVFGAVLGAHTATFSSEIRGMVSEIIDTTLLLFKEAQTTFLPSPIKFHYIFSVRDLTQIFHGLLLTREELYTDKCHFLRAWRNEVTRVLCDRLMNEEDQRIMNNRINEAVAKNFTSCHHYVMRNPLLFGDFRNAMIQTELRKYEDLLDYQAVYHLFTEIMLSFNKTNESMELILFEDALEHVTRIHRVLRHPRGHVLLLGAPNSGKRSLTKLASFTAECQVSPLTVRRYHTCGYFQEKTLQLVSEIGLKNQETTYLVTCEHTMPNEFLEILNEIITNNSVSYLVNDHKETGIDEKVKKQTLKPISDQDEKSSERSEESLDNLHVVLCISPVHDQFKKNCTVYPGIIRSSYIDWIFPWSKQALKAVATTLLKDVEVLPEAEKPNIIDSIVHVHHSTSQRIDNYFQTNGIRCYLGPTHFLKFISDYLNSINMNRRKMTLKTLQLTQVQKKLDESNFLLEALNQKLAEKKKLISEKLAAIDQLSDGIAEAEELLNAKGDELKETALQASTVRKMMYEQEAQIEDLMNKANPQLYSGWRALSELDQETVSAMCSSLVIPEPVQVVCECVAILRGAANLEWTTVREYMEDPFVLTKLREMDHTAVTDETQQRIKTRLRSSRRIGEMEQISTGGYGILKYLEHILQFCHIYKDVKPMQIRAKDYEKQWHKLTADVDSTNEAISSLEKKLAGMKAELKDGGSKQEKMMEETRKMDLELEVANSLFASLNKDSESWKRDLRKMQYEIENVYGDCLLSTAFLNYASVFDQENRHQIIYGDWRMCLRSKSVRVTDYYNVENHLSEDLSITRWLAEGLPKESHAVQNVILIKQSQKCPILIDPDKQMRKWIMVHEKENGVQSLSTHDSKFDEKLIVALKNGKPVVLCEFKYLNELLLCVLQPSFMEDGSMIVQIGSEQIPCNPNFRLYIIISCFQDTLDPTVYTSATIIDCTLGEAIEEKSSQIAMTCFDPAIGAEQRELQLHRFRISGNLRSLQEITLQKLHEYQGNIFDDFLFIQELTKLRNESEHLVSRMDQEAAQLDAIDAQRRSHSSIAKRTAVMFRSFNNMKKLSPANRTSFETFSLVLEKILVQLNTELHANPLERLTKDLFSFQSAGLSNKDKLVYGLLLAAELKIEARQLTASKFEAFVNGWRTRAATDAPPHDWISNTQWGMVESLAISFPSQFESMIDDISANGEEWKKWLQGKRENAWTLPGAIDQNFDSSFDKLLVIKSLRKDALLYSIQYFIKEVLGEDFLTPSTLRFEDIMHVTTCETPILVSVGRGSDPLPKLLALNKKIHQNPICDHISLGRGSEKLVLEKVSQSIQQGTWLIIQNCHVIPSFMYELHQTFCSFEHKNSTFRLWMTTEDVSVFLLQFVLSSHKIVIEEPTPVKISLLDTYESLDPEQFSSCVHPAFRSTVFALAFFHGVIEERKKFGKYGWNMDYNFTKTDLLVSITIIKQYLDKIFNEGNFRIPWDSLRYFIGEVVYGGRVTDDHDRRILNTYIHEYFGDFILESTKPFEFNRMGTICQYPLPPFGERQDYIDYIRSLPLLTEPSVFGVHDKRQHDVEIDEAEDVCQKLAIISNRLIGDSEFNSLGRQNDEILTIISSIESKIPDTFQYEKLKMSIGSDPQPMMLCLIRELKTFNQLIATMKSSLDGVRKVVTGLSVTTNEISEVRDQLMSHSPPRLWTKFVPECDQNVGKWLLTLGRRSNQFEKWVTRGEPWILWLAGLAYPQAYLTAIAQVACREEGWPMDAVAFHTEVTEYQKRSAIPSKPKTGLYVEGLFLDGAQWDFAEKCLQTLTGDTSIYPLPIIGLFTSPARGLPIQGCLKLPVYATPKRKKSENGKVITELNIPTKKHESFWILENVYIVMNAEFSSK